MRRWKYLIAAVLLVGLACAGYFTYVWPTASMTDEEWDICEAVLRHQIFKSAAAGRGKAAAYVKVQGRNPTGAFLDRFRDHEPPVRAGWQFSFRGGVQYHIGVIERMGEDAAAVSGGYYEGNLSASGNIYYVVRKDGKWVVERDERHWISQAPMDAPRHALLNAGRGIP